MARRLFQNSRAPELQSSKAPELRSLQSAWAPELQSAICSFFTFFFQNGWSERHVWWFIGITIAACSFIVCFKEHYTVSKLQSARAPERQSARAPELQSFRASELQSAIRFFFAFFSKWLIGSWSCFVHVVYRFHHVPHGCCGRSICPPHVPWCVERLTLLRRWRFAGAGPCFQVCAGASHQSTVAADLALFASLPILASCERSDETRCLRSLTRGSGWVLRYSRLKTPSSDEGASRNAL